MGGISSTITGLSTPQSTPPSVKGYDDQMEGPLETFLEVSKKIGGDVATMGAQPSNAQSGKSMPKKGSSPPPSPPPPEDLFTAPSSGGGGGGEGGFNRPALFNSINKADEQIITGPSNKNDTDNNIVVASSDTGDGFELLQLSAQPSPNLLDVPESSELCGQEAIEHVVKLGSRQKVCANCHCTSTILWGQNQHGKPVCNACGLYYNLHQHDRPLTMQKEAVMQTPKHNHNRVCSNCRCTATTLWRQNERGERLCNACGLYYNLHQHDRPFPKPKVELKDHRIWLIEFHRDNRDINVQADIKQSVYVYQCENSVVHINGKVNSVTVDSCKKTSVVFDSLLAHVEVINSQSVKVQSFGALPTISIQKTDGCHVYLSKESLGAEIMTCKSSELNVMVPNGDGDFTEFPVSEQFKTTFDAAGNKLKTELLDIV